MGRPNPIVVFTVGSGVRLGSGGSGLTRSGWWLDIN